VPESDWNEMNAESRSSDILYARKISGVMSSMSPVYLAPEGLLIWDPMPLCGGLDIV
jgi:hypothetical protein